MDIYLPKINANSILPSTRRDLLALDLSVTTLKALLPSPILATYIAHMGLLVFIYLTLLGKLFKL